MDELPVEIRRGILHELRAEWLKERFRLTSAIKVHELIGSRTEQIASMTADAVRCQQAIEAVDAQLAELT